MNRIGADHPPSIGGDERSGRRPADYNDSRRCLIPRTHALNADILGALFADAGSFFPLETVVGDFGADFFRVDLAMNS